MKLAGTFTIIAAIFGIILGDAWYVNSAQIAVKKGCSYQTAYDKSGDLTCPQKASNHGK